MIQSSVPRPSTSQPRPEDVGVRAQPKPCGGCSLCCKVLHIRELNKPMGVWCRHIATGGCGVYSERPDVCRGYQCTWTWADPLDERWRPDRAGFLLNPTAASNQVELVVDPDRPDAWRREPYYSQLKQWSHPANPFITRVLVRVRTGLIVIFPETDIELGPPATDPWFIRSGYAMKDGRLQPYARYSATADGD